MRNIKMNKFKISNLVGMKLKELRVLQGLKINDIAKRINKSDQQLFRYEKGINKIDIDTLFLYLDELNVDVPEFFLTLIFEMNKENNLIEKDNT